MLYRVCLGVYYLLFTCMFGLIPFSCFSLVVVNSFCFIALHVLHQKNCYIINFLSLYLPVLNFVNKDSHCFSVRLFLRQMSEGSLDLCADVLNWGSFSDQCFFFLMVIGCATQIKVAMSLELCCYSGVSRPIAKAKKSIYYYGHVIS